MVKGGREFYNTSGKPYEIPDLLKVQKESFNNFIQKNILPNKRENSGLQGVFNGIFPIEDSQNRFELKFISYELSNPKYTPEEAIVKGTNHSSSLRLKLAYITKDENSNFVEAKEQDVYLCDLPLMTDKADFVINGIKRVIVSQLHRSPGVFFKVSYHLTGKMLILAQIIPYKGSWIDINLNHNNIITISLDRRRKFPISIWLQAIGLGDKGEILEKFLGSEEILTPKVNTKTAEKLIGRVIRDDIVDPQTGEVIVESGSEITSNLIEMMNSFGKKKIVVIKSDNISSLEALRRTFEKVKRTLTREEAAEYIYRFVRGTDPVNAEAAIDYINNIYLSDKRYIIGPVGRKMMKDKLGVEPKEKSMSLTPEDFIQIINYMFNLLERQSDAEDDDIDHLGNRQVRRVSELLVDIFNSALYRVTKGVKEKIMSDSDPEKLTPQQLVNSRFVTSAVNTFFASSQLSQFMEQTNPLTEMTHKRRLSALGPNGLTRDTAGFEVRDVHHSHYGRICPIETPEGPNIGLITSLAIHAKVNKFGFIETPYKKVKNGKVTNEIEYISAHKEDKHIIAQANELLDSRKKFFNKEILARQKDDYPVVRSENIDYMDAAPAQILSASAALIPFMEHDEANRALMGSNMQRQAVPLVITKAPFVGTGMEEVVARDSKTVLVAKRKGKVIYADSMVIKIKPDKVSAIVFGEEDIDIYKLNKFKMTNQNTCNNQKPIVKEGDRVEEGEIIADGAATDTGELALGKNVLVAFMLWRGYNFEDAIVVSERLAKQDTFTSIQIKNFTLDVRETKLGPEELTSEIPNTSDESTKNLTQEGIVRVGAEVSSDDILVGKVTPKGETELSPQEKLLKAIFGEKAADVRDTSLRVPPGIEGTVIDVQVLSRRTGTISERKNINKKIKEIENRYYTEISRIEIIRNNLLSELLKGKKFLDNLYSKDGKLIIKKSKNLSEKVLKEVNWLDLEIPDKCLKTDMKKFMKIIDESSKRIYDLYRKKNNEIETLKQGDELPHGLLKRITVFIAQKRKISVGDKMSGRHGNKGVVSVIVSEEDMPYMDDGTPIDIVLNPLGVPSRMNIGQVLETHLGWAANKLNIKIATPVFDGITIEKIEELLKKADLPVSGKVKLTDGKTGEKINDEITVGYNYMLKLNHMVDDKIHARSIGPYSMITQQPLGGKAHFGGQRVGEMEVWALEAYGAAYTLQEMLTVKSDDIYGRTKMYEAIIKGENPPEPGLPASFNVLLKELNGLCLNVELKRNKPKLTKN